MGGIVTQHPIVNWRKKTVKIGQMREKEEKRLNVETIPDGALQQFFAL